MTREEALAEIEAARREGRPAQLAGADLTGTDLGGRNLYRANLTGAILTGADLSGALLRDADLSDAILIEADLRSAILYGANLTSADLTRANLNLAKLTDANLNHAKLRDTNLTRSSLTRSFLAEADLTGANMTGANLREAVLRGANLTRATLDRAEFIAANLNEANLTNAHLYHSNLGSADLEHAELEGANLTDAILDSANLTDAILRGANLTDAILRGANLQGANLTGANLEAANLEGAYLVGANLTNATLTGAKLKNTLGLYSLVGAESVVWPADFRLPGPRFQEHYSLSTPDTENFRRWFKNSQATTPEGAAAVVYHGTDLGGFSQFDPAKIDPHHPGFYFSDELQVASSYSVDPAWPFEDPTPELGSPDKTGMSGAYRLFLSLQNPVVVDCKSSNWNRIDHPDFPGLRKTYEIAAEAKRRGYDGVIFKNIWDDGGKSGEPKLGTVYVAFEPTQIKSALFNTGEFSPTDPDIRKNPRRRKTSRRVRRTSRS